MNILTNVVRWLCAVFIGIILPIWLILITLHITLGNREVVKTWLASSGVYNTGLANFLKVDASMAGGTTDANITTKDLQDALNKTFDNKYLQTNTNKAVDAAYDWIEGKNSAIVFTIPVQDKAGEFSANLATIIEPKIASLPKCANTANYPSCVPSNVSAADYAKQVTKLSGNANFLNSPITATTVSSNFINYPWLPSAYAFTRTLLVALPIAFVILAGLYIVVSRDKLWGLLLLGRQITVASLVLLVFGGAMWLGGNYLNIFGSSAADAQQIAFVNPLIKSVLCGVGGALSMVSGGAVAMGGLIWLGAWLWIRNSNNKPSNKSRRSDDLYDKTDAHDKPAPSVKSLNPSDKKSSTPPSNHPPRMVGRM